MTKKCKTCGATLHPKTFHCNPSSAPYEACGIAWICDKDGNIDLKTLPCTEKCKKRPG